METCVTETVVIPGFAIVKVCVFVTPVVTLPNAAEVGVRVKPGWEPVPLNETVSKPLPLWPTNEICTLPEKDCAAVGWNTTEKLTLAWGPSV